MKVIKRNGRVEDCRFDKVVQRIHKLTDGLSPLVDSQVVAQQVFSSMYDGIHTREIDDLSAETCIALFTTDPDYELLAARIVASNIQKTAPNNFNTAMKKLKAAGIVTDEVVKMSAIVKDKIVPERDYDFSFFGLKTLQRGYLTKVDNLILETPQYMYMRVAIGIHGEDVDNVLRTYDDLSLHKYIHATPTLFNAGTNHSQMSSCFLLANKSDSIDGIFDTIHDCASISKWAGGIGLHIHDVRARGSKIRGTNGQSDGIVPMLRVLNNVARYVNQGGGKRKGSIAIYLEPWHADVFEFLDLRLNTGDEEMRCRDLFTALWIPDEFMRRVQNDGEWTLMCPDECPGLSDVHGDAFDELYRKYESEGRGKKTVRAQELWRAILRSQIETGTPYMLYKDAMQKSNQSHLGVIKSSNLCCVAPETKILTSKGQLTISDLKDQEVEVWNGEEFSTVIVRQTGVDQKLLTVTTSRGLSLRCTDYHKFYVLGDDNKIETIEAKDLQSGMRLIKHDLPLIESSDLEMKYAYTHGFFCADGTTAHPGEERRCSYKAKENGLCMRHQSRVIQYEDDGMCRANSCVEVKYVDLYHGKRALLEHIVHENSTVCESQQKIRCTIPFDIEDKYFVPINYSLKTKLDWLSGVLDGDGTVVRHVGGHGCSIQLGSIHKKFLTDISLMLQTLGCHSTITQAHKERKSDLPGGMYTCKPVWRLLIASKAVEHLHMIGLRPRRLVLGDGVSDRDAMHFQRIVSVEDLGDTADTFCFNEPKKHAGVFNGILTSQCEIAEFTTPDETAVCNLASVALPKYITDGAKFDYEELHRVTKQITRNLDRVIDRNFYPIESARNSNTRHRPIGIGVQGLADVFQILDLAFDCEESRAMNAAIFETMYHAALEASCELSQELGSYSSFEGSPASRGILQFDMWEGATRFSGKYDWDAMRERVKKGLRNSLLLAPMPTASTAQILGNCEAFEPYTQNIYLRRVLAGEFTVVNRHLVRDLKARGLWSHDMKNLIIRANGSIQNIVDIKDDHLKQKYRTVWEIPQRSIIEMAADRGRFIDQSQSMNLFVSDPSYGKMSSMHMFAWKSGLKTGMYYLRTKPKANAQKFTLDPEQNECVACSA